MLLIVTLSHSCTQAFLQHQQLVATRTEIMSAQSTGEELPTHHAFCDLPGDPSLILTTNVDLGDKKMEIMKCEFIRDLWRL